MHIEPGMGGLSTEEAAIQLKKYGSNLLPGSQPKSLFSIIFKVIKEPMFLMLLLAGGIYMALGDRAEAAFLLSFVLFCCNFLNYVQSK